MNILIVKRDILKKPDYSPDARHFVHSSGDESPMFGMDYTVNTNESKFVFLHTAQKEIRRGLKDMIYKYLAAYNLSDSSTVILINSIEPDWAFFTSKSEGLMLRGRIDLIIPRYMSLEDMTKGEVKTNVIL